MECLSLSLSWVGPGLDNGMTWQWQREQAIHSIMNATLVAPIMGWSYRFDIHCAVTGVWLSVQLQLILKAVKTCVGAWEWLLVCAAHWLGVALFCTDTGTKPYDDRCFIATRCCIHIMLTLVVNYLCGYERFIQPLIHSYKSSASCQATTETTKLCHCNGSQTYSHMGRST